MKNIIAYIRVSTDGQVGEDKYGLEAQKEQIIEYCRKNDLNIVKWVSDEGESGAKFRPGFDEIVYGDITNPPYEAVVVAKSDRVARDINIYFYYQGALLKKGIELISISEDFGQFGVFANMLKAFTITCAEMERENITKRTSSGRAIKSATGGYSGGRPPFGYVAIGGKLEIEESQAEIVRLIFKMRAEGKTLADVSNWLNANGYKTKTGGKFFTSSIQNIENNKKLYQGYYKYGKMNDWIKGIHQPIIEDD